MIDRWPIDVEDGSTRIAMTKTVIKNTVFSAKLTGVVLLNLGTAQVLCVSENISVDGFNNAIKTWQNITVAGVVGFLVIVLNHICDHAWKARLVFWQWRNPLPGCRAFSDLARSDPRIDLSKLKEAVGPFPREPGKQNALWYRIYRSLDSNPEIVNAHKNYLYLRDWSCIALLLSFFMVPSSYVLCSFPIRRLFIAMFLVGEYLLVRLAAANAGKRFVSTVLAIKAVRSVTETTKDGDA